MGSLFRKKSPVDRRMKALKKELSLVDTDIRSLSKDVEKQGMSSELLRLREEVDYQAQVMGTPWAADVPSEPNETIGTGHAEKAQNTGKRTRKAAIARLEEERVIKERGQSIRDERFSDYLSGTFQSVQPLRQERGVQRNRAIVMVVIALLGLIWLWHTFLSKLF
jgi:hypothetical protein